MRPNIQQVGNTAQEKPMTKEEAAEWAIFLFFIFFKLVFRALSGVMFIQVQRYDTVQRNQSLRLQLTQLFFSIG